MPPSTPTRSCCRNKTRALFVFYSVFYSVSKAPVTITPEMLRAIFTKPAPRSDTRPLLTRLLTSIQPVVRFGRRGLSFIGVQGRVKF